MKYRVEIQCRDCTNQDDEGCNFGVPWSIVDADGKPTEFDSKEAAEEAGDEATNDNHTWFYEVIPIHGS